MTNVFKETVKESITEGLLPALDALATEHYADMNYDFGVTHTVKFGSKNAKIVVMEHGEETRVLLFIEMATGNILKAASWKAPAKHARGNIFTNENYGVGNAISVYGAAYLR